MQELWLKHLKIQLSLSNTEIKLLREYWREKFKADEITVLLDGFDELQDEAVECRLNKCVRETASALHGNTLLISTRPYAQHRLGNEGLQELEIEPLNQSQIEAFLNCYYPNDETTIDSEKAVYALISTLNYSKSRLRSSAAQLLEMIGLEKVIYVLSYALNHIDSNVRGGGG